MEHPAGSVTVGKRNGSICLPASLLSSAMLGMTLGSFLTTVSAAVDGATAVDLPSGELAGVEIVSNAGKPQLRLQRKSDDYNTSGTYISRPVPTAARAFSWIPQWI